jgi:hypothetical protein
MRAAPLASPDENAQIAAQLREAAALLQAQEGNPFRVGAYRKAADAAARRRRSGGSVSQRPRHRPGKRARHSRHAARGHAGRARSGGARRAARGCARRGEWHFTALFSNTARARRNAKRNTGPEHAMSDRRVLVSAYGELVWSRKR